MGISNYIPFSSATRQLVREDDVIELDYDQTKGISKILRASTLALGYTGLSSLGNRASFESAPYDFVRINKAADTDSFIKQGLNKYRELMWKEGWDIVGENDEAIQYLQERLDFMELAMGRSFGSLLSDISDQLFRFNNAFVVKSRGNLAPFFPGEIRSKDPRGPVVGYYIIPAETVEIKRSKNNQVLGYSQKTDSIISYSSAGKQPTWKPEDVIHFSVDKKPGTAFGTPFMVSVLDDVISLRQMEEDIQNMVHKELFPLYVYKVGTETSPSTQEEIDLAVMELESLRNDGGLVLPERHNVDVLGAESKSLDANEYLQHFVIRVCVGLGLSPHHLGVLMNGGNRSVTDRLDVALYDRIKSYQKYFGDTVRLAMFYELLVEGGFNPLTNPAREGVSDRCEFKFKEIDVDTQVKKENHILGLWQSNLLELEEVREFLGRETDVDESRLYASIIGKIETDQAVAVAKANQGGNPNKGDAPSSDKPNTNEPSKGGKPNRKNTKRGVGNKVAPANQHGRRTSPAIRRMDDAWLSNVVELLNEDDTLDT